MVCFEAFGIVEFEEHFSSCFINEEGIKEDYRKYEGVGGDMEEEQRRYEGGASKVLYFNYDWQI